MLLPFLVPFLLATATPTPLEEAVDALLAKRPEATSRDEPLVRKHLAHDELEKATTWQATPWDVVKLGGRTLVPRAHGMILPWGLPAMDAVVAPEVLAYLAGATVSTEEAVDTVAPTRLADLVLAQALEDVVGRVTSTTDLPEMLEPLRALTQDPGSDAARAALFAPVLKFDARRARELWDRGAFVVAAGLLAAAASPSELPPGERDSLVVAAQTILASLLELRPDTGVALHLLGVSHLWRAAYAETGAHRHQARAIEALDRGIRADPEDPRSYLSLALHYRTEGNRPDALAVLAGAIERLGKFKDPWKARILRHLAALHWERATPERPWALAESYRLYRRAVEEHETLESSMSIALVWEELEAAGADLLAAEPVATHVHLRLKLARHILKLSEDRTEQPTAEEWLTAYHPLLETTLAAGIAGLRQVPDVAHRDDLIKKLHWAWSAYADATAELSAAIWPSVELTQITRDLVEESNTRRWKARQLKLGKYDRRLAQEL